MAWKRMAARAAAAAALCGAGAVHAEDCPGTIRAAQGEACLRKTLAASDETLRRQFDELMARADADRRELLLSSQQSWHRYRDSQCALERDLTRVMHDPYGRVGTLAPTLDLLCQLRLNDERVAVLRGADRGSPRR